MATVTEPNDRQTGRWALNVLLIQSSLTMTVAVLGGILSLFDPQEGEDPARTIAFLFPALIGLAAYQAILQMGKRISELESQLESRKPESP